MVPAGNEDRAVRVLIVDDTRAIRSMIRTLLSSDSRIHVAGEAGDPYEAREKIKALDPDVLTLDVEMPRMNGLQFLEHLMRLRPMPVLMVSSRTTDNSELAVRALSLGAVDCVDVAKLLAGGRKRTNLVDAVLLAAASRPRLRQANTGCNGTETGTRYEWNGRVVVIGASTGGVDALETVLSDFPANCPPTLIAQHMPAPFLESFTARLDRQSKPRVVPASDGMEMEAGLVCVAPGGNSHATLSPENPLRVSLLPHDGTESYVPSVNVLFSSAQAHARSVTAVMLTGMGRDGAVAMLRLRRAGAHTIVQNAESAVVDGMPRAAREIGAAVEVADISMIGERILASAMSRQEAAP